jgi:hypothetical protein
MAVCHSAGGEQRLAVFSPAEDRRRAVFETHNTTIRYVFWPDRLEITTDGDATPEIWMPAARWDPELVRTVAANTALAAGRAATAPPPPVDREAQALVQRVTAIAEAQDATALIALAAPDILTSFGGSSTLDEFRALVSEPWFWEEFGRALAGGAVLSEGWPDGRRVVFPAAFETWPAGLDPYEFLYADRPGAVLRAGPSDGAPALTPLNGAILAEVPQFEGSHALYEAGWAFLCAEPVGCGFARRSEVRSPIDWRASFLQSAPGGAWVLESFVAGD